MLQFSTKFAACFTRCKSCNNCTVESKLSVWESVNKSTILRNPKREISSTPATSVYSLNVIKLCHGLSRRVDALNY